MTKRMEAAGRQSNLELLRIIAIFMIIVFHCSFKSGFSFEPGFSVNKLAVKAFWMLGELGGQPVHADLRLFYGSVQVEKADSTPG